MGGLQSVNGGNPLANPAHHVFAHEQKLCVCHIPLRHVYLITHPLEVAGLIAASSRLGDDMIHMGGSRHNDAG
jgi:hypothetical protein